MCTVRPIDVTLLCAEFGVMFVLHLLNNENICRQEVVVVNAWLVMSGNKGNKLSRQRSMSMMMLLTNVALPEEKPLFLMTFPFFHLGKISI